MARTKKRDQENFNQLVAGSSNVNIEATAASPEVAERGGQGPQRRTLPDIGGSASFDSPTAIRLFWKASERQILLPKTNDQKLQAHIARDLESALESEAEVLADIAETVRADGLVVAFQGSPKEPEQLEAELGDLILKIKAAGHLQPYDKARSGGESFGFTIEGFWGNLELLPISSRHPQPAEHEDRLRPIPDAARGRVSDALATPLDPPLPRTPALKQKTKRRSRVTLESVRATLRQRVQQSGLTYEDIGPRMGLSKESSTAALARLLSKEGPDPRLSTLIALARAVNCSLAELLGCD
jgi:hypothetical protein